MATERHNLVRRIDPALSTIPPQDVALVEAYIRPLEPTTAFFHAQREEGFYGNLTAGDILPPDGDLPHTLIRSNGGDKAYKYGEIEPYRRYLREISRRMYDIIDVANDINDPEKRLIEASLRPRAQALRDGNFAEAMMLGLGNSRLTTRYSLFIGLLDRYLDPRGLKLVMQGWLQRLDFVQNEHFNDLSRQIAGRLNPKFRVIYGDMLAAGGMTRDKLWSGNTVPSEDDIRIAVGADSYVFSNNMDKSTQEVDIPAIQLYLPQITRISNWEDAIFNAKRVGIVAHETGHAEMPFDEKTIGRLGSRYMAIKELIAELFATTRISGLSANLVSRSLKQFIYARSLATWRHYSDQYNAETEPDRKAILRHYAMAGAWRTNYQERGGGIKVNEDGKMEVSDWDKFVEMDKNLYQEFLRAIVNEEGQSGFIDLIIQLNSRLPRAYLTD